MYNNNLHQSQNQAKLDNCLIHSQDQSDTHHQNHNLLHSLHKELPLYKNLHLQDLQEQEHNSNLFRCQNQANLGSCLIHIQNHLDTHHENHNLLHFQNKHYNSRIHHFHCLKWHSQILQL